MSGGVGESPEEIRQASAFEKFDAICRTRDLTADQLSAQDDATLEAWVREEMPEKTRKQQVDVSLLRLLLREYVAEAV